MNTIKQRKGNLITELNQGIMVHGCNAKGVMGSGFAKGIKETYFGAFRAYHEVFQQKGLRLGEVIFYRVPRPDDNDLIIANAITQERYGRDKSVVYVDYPAISTCFELVAKKARELNLPVHFPLIGCGHANGKWPEVSARIEAALGPDIEKTLWIQ